MYTYRWNAVGNATIISTTNTASGLKSGTYQVSVYSTTYTTCIKRLNVTLDNPG